MNKNNCASVVYMSALLGKEKGYNTFQKIYTLILEGMLCFCNIPLHSINIHTFTRYKPLSDHWKGISLLMRPVVTVLGNVPFSPESNAIGC